MRHTSNWALSATLVVSSCRPGLECACCMIAFRTVTHTRIADTQYCFWRQEGRSPFIVSRAFPVSQLRIAPEVSAALSPSSHLNPANLAPRLLSRGRSFVSNEPDARATWLMCKLGDWRFDMVYTSEQCYRSRCRRSTSGSPTES